MYGLDQQLINFGLMLKYRDYTLGENISCEQLCENMTSQRKKLKTG